MRVPPLGWLPLLCAVVVHAASGPRAAPAAKATDARPALPSGFRSVLIRPAQAAGSRIREWRREGRTGVTLELTSGGEADVLAAAQRVRDAGLPVYYWIEVGRCPELADRHPEWLASLQGHPEWRRLFPKVRQPGPDEVVKNYPWVPVLYAEASAAHFQRVRELLRGLPRPAGLFLNDLQGPPSACGCGNTLCRWTADYGPLHTATRLPPDAAAKFVSEVRKLLPGVPVVSVWATECEPEEQHAACSGVGCFPGACWRDFTAQLMPVARQTETLGALCLYRSFHRDTPRYGGEAGWVGHALRSFQEMPPLRGGEAVPANRLVAVLQGWDVTESQLRAEVQETHRAGSRGELLALTPIAQDWEPRVFALTAHGAAGPRVGAATQPPAAGGGTLWRSQLLSARHRSVRTFSIRRHLSSSERVRKRSCLPRRFLDPEKV